MSIQTILRHQGIQSLAVAMLASFMLMLAVPDTFLQMSRKQKQEYLRTLRRKIRRKGETLFDLDYENDCY
ncbi:hypothetical protein PBT90_00090 [Algoriphagus halophytocola]|uniref:hypothetical protein n=1 Tax=Algoriphagus halophytocola TaxID=2991499 RepID=UPI0022DDA3C4|nr:hypothetical protein [Algoriphagus sp. TR-M9]WBL42356.1 hypothetical protein PBT90_16595 [Algoriphagus sp. TR-M9]WBL43107.1 hypothetical protein PBT90_00090 [Algoriphagus sp. TR-M9]